MEATLIFDGDCSFCTSSVRFGERQLSRRDGTDPTTVPWQFTDLEALGTTRERAQHEVLWVSREGVVYGGAQAVARWLIHRGGAYGVAGRVLTVPPLRQIAAGVYRLLANNRSRLPGGSPACALPPAGYDVAQAGRRSV